MTTAVSVRDFADHDSSAVIAIARMLQAHERQFFDRLKPANEIGPDYLSSIQTDVAARQGRFFVASRNDAIVGYATLLTRCDSREDAEEIFYEYAHVGDLAVHEDHRSCGVGQALMAACENAARAAGLKWLRLAVLADNALARNFYRTAGFRDMLVRVEKPL